MLEADRNLRYQLGYASKWTYLSRLMHRFHKALAEHESSRARLEELFRQIKAAFQEVPQFADFVGELRGQLADLVATMTHRLEVDFEAYNPVNFFQALRLQAAEGDEPRALEEMGTGEQQVLAMAFAYAYAKAFHGGIVLVIEEPEAHLHPLAQQWLARRLAKMATDGLQILITTHSPSYVDILGLEGLALVTKTDEGTRVTQVSRQDVVKQCIALGVPVTKATVDNILPFYAVNASPELLGGFFARVVVLVEGPTEAFALPIYFEKCGLPVAKEGVAVIPVHGKGNLGKWRRLFKTYGIPSYVVFDNDVEDDGNGNKRKDALRAVGIPDAAHHYYVESPDWIVAEIFTVFGTDFETTLRNGFPAYTMLEDNGRELGIDSKPFIARHVAERLDPADGAAGWTSVRAMTKAVWTLLGVDPPAS